MANRTIAASPGVEIRGEAEFVGALGAQTTVAGLDAVALASDVVPEGRAQDEPGVGRTPAQLLEQPLRVDVHAPGVAGAVQAGVWPPEPVVRYLGRTRGPRDGVGVVRAVRS